MGVYVIIWLVVGRCGWLGVDRCGWVWMGVVSKDFKGFLFVMYFCQVFVVLAGCGWVWLAVYGFGWVWLGALFRTAQFRLVNYLENGRDYILKENKDYKTSCVLIIPEVSRANTLPFTIFHNTLKLF